ncbi:helix-turn-helix domain-containing protein [Flavobacterium sp. LAR06]|uniref:helix-turn-helix domain-containing protein n=1 Tax=Flavobacterium sp. LAR06 TaxID=3064897 RepID=UPI0035C2173B
MNDNNKVFTSVDIIEIRKNKNLTQLDLASLLGVDKKTILNYENGNHVIPFSQQKLLTMLVAAEKQSNLVLVFKTNVNSFSEVKRITPKLNSSFPDVKWNFDLEDCDRILRFETENDITEEIVLLMEELGFKCEAL